MCVALFVALYGTICGTVWHYIWHCVTLYVIKCGTVYQYMCAYLWRSVCHFIHMAHLRPDHWLSALHCKLCTDCMNSFTSCGMESEKFTGFAFLLLEGYTLSSI